MTDTIDEVLNIQQRLKRATIARINQKKLERSREIAKKKMANDNIIKKRAYHEARKRIRRRFASKRGESYETLSPSEKMSVDKMIEGKQKLIKRLALRLIPRIRRQEAIRLQSFMKGAALEDMGKKEGAGMNEEFNERFNAFLKEAKEAPKKLSKKKTPIVFHTKFSEEAEAKSDIYKALEKKAEKSGIELETLGEIYDRGIDAWTEGKDLTPQQYAFNRVNSFLSGGRALEEDVDLFEGKMKDLAHDLEHMNHGNFKQKYGKDKKHFDSLHPKGLEELSKNTYSNYLDKSGAEIKKSILPSLHGWESAKKHLNKRIKGYKAAAKKYNEDIDSENELIERSLKIGSYCSSGNDKVTLHRSDNDRKHHMLVNNGKVIASFHKATNDVHKELVSNGFKGRLHEETLDELSNDTLSNYKRKATNQKDASKIFYDKDHHDKMKNALGSNDPVVKNLDREKNTIRKRTSGLDLVKKKLKEEAQNIIIENMSEDMKNLFDTHRVKNIYNNGKSYRGKYEMRGHPKNISKLVDKLSKSGWKVHSFTKVSTPKTDENNRTYWSGEHKFTHPEHGTIHIPGTVTAGKEFKDTTRIKEYGDTVYHTPTKNIKEEALTEGRTTFKDLHKPIKNHPHQDFLTKAHHIMKDDSHLKPEDKINLNATGHSKHEWIQSTGKKSEKTHNTQAVVSHKGHIYTGPDVDKPARLDNEKVEQVRKLAKKHGFEQSKEQSHILTHPETKATLYLHNHVKSYHPHDTYGSFHLRTPYHHFESIKEEVLDELSRRKLIDYTNKAGDPIRRNDHERGINAALVKLGYGNRKAKVYAKEEAKSADKKPVVVPSYKDQYGNTVPAKTVMKKSNRKIVNTGDNPHDGD